MKIALITGPCPAGECGVGDYTACLGHALRAKGVEAHVIDTGDWRMMASVRTKKSLGQQGFDILHVEYPTIGFGTNLGPQALSLLTRCVVTVHEASQRCVLRKLSLIPFAVRPRHIIFTSSFERKFATKWLHWIMPPSSVIPVGSSIPRGRQTGIRSTNEIVHFGLIMPKKGLEAVLELAVLVKSAGLPFRIRICGKVPTQHRWYLSHLRSQTVDLPVTWECDLGAEEIAERLSGSSIAYLPYPDGASERRTTLKAALMNGVAVITTRGPHTPSDLNEVVQFCRMPADAVATICGLFDRPTEIARLSSAATEYVRTFAWETIAESHLKVYRALHCDSVSQMQPHCCDQTSDLVSR